MHKIHFRCTAQCDTQVTRADEYATRKSAGGVQRTIGLSHRLGKPLEVLGKDGQITELRTFFQDCQQW